jgi:GTP-binding protein
MDIKRAEFKGVYTYIKEMPDESVPESAIVGRSNVGKSSLINRITNCRKLAKSSSTPGKTRTINFYLINEQWYMVDLPGYGYARVSKAEKARWRKMIEDYLRYRSQLKGVIQLIDVRHPPSDNDILMKEWLVSFKIPVLFVATKIDKISRGARQKHFNVIRKGLDLQSRQLPLGFSAETGEGVQELKEAIDELLAYPGNRGEV